MMPETTTKVIRPKKLRAAVSNRLFEVPGLDGRKPSARRFRDLSENFADALGGAANLSDGQRMLVQRAAGITVAAEGARARLMCGEHVEIGELVKLENLADRAVRALRINLGAQPKARTLDDYLAGKQGEAA
jgi:hypothetical protein